MVLTCPPAIPWPLRSGREMWPGRRPTNESILPTREVCHEEVPVAVSRCRLPAGRVVHRPPGPGRRQAAPCHCQPHGLATRPAAADLGWADPSEEITVRLDDATATATADAQGNWKVVLPAVKVDGKAHRMTVSGKNKIELDDILIGDVWIGSGQSNMELGLTMCQNGKGEAAAANYPKIRLLLIPKTAAKKPAKDVQSPWVRCQPDTVQGGRLGWLLRRALLFRPAAAQRPGRADRVDRGRLGRLGHRALDGHG